MLIKLFFSNFQLGTRTGNTAQGINICLSNHGRIYDYALVSPFF